MLVSNYYSRRFKIFFFFFFASKIVDQFSLVGLLCVPRAVRVKKFTAKLVRSIRNIASRYVRLTGHDTSFCSFFFSFSFSFSFLVFLLTHLKLLKLVVYTSKYYEHIQARHLQSGSMRRFGIDGGYVYTHAKVVSVPFVLCLVSIVLLQQNDGGLRTNEHTTGSL